MHRAESIDRQRDWESRYRSGETGWDRGQVSPALTGWLADDAVPPGRVLVPGCGNGYEVLALARTGHYVTAVDIASTPVMQLMGALTEHQLHAKVIQADLLDWTPAEPFDAVYEQTCLCALDPAQWQTYAQRLANWLLPGGKLFALFMQTQREGGPPFHCALPQMRELFADDQWCWPDQAQCRVDHPNGLHELAFVLTRRGAEQDGTG